MAEVEAKKSKYECKCNYHDQWKDFTGENAVLHIERGKVSSQVINFLREHHFLGPRSSFLCKSCIFKTNNILHHHHHHNNTNTNTTKTANVPKASYQVDNEDKPTIQKLVQLMICQLEDDSVEIENVGEADWSKLLYLIGTKILFPRIQKQGSQLSKKYKSVDHLTDIDPDSDITHYDAILVSFLEGLSSRGFLFLNTKTKFHVICIIEAIYSYCNFNWVLPYNFVSNLIQSFISGSKMVTVLNGKLSPGGGYTTYLTWLKGIGAEALTCPFGDIVTYIDNIGKYIIKLYEVSRHKTQSADVITTCLHINLQEEAKLQSKSSLKPNLWGENLTINEKQILMKGIIEASRVVFRRCRYNYISHIIDVYKSEEDSVKSRISKLILIQKRHCSNAVSRRVQYALLSFYKSYTFFLFFYQII